MCLGNFEQDFRNESRVCGDWLLYHDNASAHSSNLVQQFLSKHSIPLKGQRFDDKTTVENNATSVLKAIPKSEFQDCFEKWKHC